MQRFTLSVCSHCRNSYNRLRPPKLGLNDIASPVKPLLVARRLWSNATTVREGSGNYRSNLSDGRGPKFTNNSDKNRTKAQLPRKPRAPKIPVTLTTQDVPNYVRSRVADWAIQPMVFYRLQAFGIPRSEINPLLEEFVRFAKSDELFTPSIYKKFRINRFEESTRPYDRSSQTDVILTSVLYQWATEISHSAALLAQGIVSEPTLVGMRSLLEAADHSFPSELYPNARRMRRKIIMHVGPTNSGKTHNALRALAAAPHGLYAGPLRLLAHEIWERLNLGQIVPAGAELNKEPVEESPTDGVDIGDGKPTVRQIGNPQYARRCNLVTGEEQKIVSEGAGLVSSTVEMVSFSHEFDVAVVDEIQMIADPTRGGGWTAAVLGLCAKELHLCGEEIAIPIIEAIVKETGDELIVNHYKRLTPLSVEKESLHGDFKNIRKGDCIVTFSRNQIFGLKEKIEKDTGLRCAVAYGKLPPEIRSEQAALFNDPDSGYDVMIGSDAIGMGLNLKIKRIVFAAMTKYNGSEEIPLSVSQTKQIAGRAGRYGLHGDDSSGGLVTTLRPADLPILEETMSKPVPPLPYARLGPNSENFARVLSALPEKSRTQTAYEAHIFLASMPEPYRFTEYPKLMEMTGMIDSRGRTMTFTDRQLLMMAPIPWRDELGVHVVGKFMQMYDKKMSVGLRKAVEGTNLLETLEEVEQLIEADVPPHSTPATLGVLETLHKVLVLYLWLSYRNPVTYHDHQDVIKLKGRTEEALDYCLEGVSKHTEEESWESKKEAKNLLKQGRAIPVDVGVSWGQ